MVIQKILICGTMILALFVFEGLLVHADDGEETGLKDGGFEEGIGRWTAKPAKDFAEIAIVNDITAPDGAKALLIEHLRTRTSSVEQSFVLDPYASYMFGVWIRAEQYLRTGMGVRLDIYADGMNFGTRFPEDTLSEEWRQIHIPFVTGATGKTQIILYLQSAVGRIFLDNVTVVKCTREEAKEIMGTGYSSPIPRIPLRPGEAECRVWYDEIPVSKTIPSYINIHVRENLGDGVWEKSGRLKIELPGGVVVSNVQPQKEETGKGHTLHTFPCKDLLQLYGGWLCTFPVMATTSLENQKARCWIEWEGGQQQPFEVDVLYLEVPRISQPQNIVAGTTCYTNTPALYTDYFKMLQGMGFNTIDFWSKGAGSEFIPQFRKHNIDVDAEHSGMSYLTDIIKETEDAQSVGLDGKRRSNVLDVTHRGPVFEKFLTDIETIAKHGFSYIMFDDEHYRDWASMDTGLTERYKKQWAQWLETYHPDLSLVMPEVFLDDPLNYFEHYQAWWFFHGDLIREWYVEGRKKFISSVRKHNAKSSREFLIGSYTGPASLAHVKTSFMNPAAMTDVFDRIMPMFYEEAIDLRSHIRELVRAVGREHAGAALCMGTARSDRWVWRPGEVRAQILEVLFSGGTGYMFWSWPYSNLRIIAEIAQTNGIVADNEAFFLDGQPTKRFWTEADRTFASCMEMSDRGLLLVSNYTKTHNDKVFVRRLPGPALVLTELFSGRQISLAAGQQSFTVATKPGMCSLWRWLE